MSEKTTRENIVKAADNLFYRNGFDHTSFADIAEVVNISRGNFYFHFKSKDEILEAVIELRAANTARMLDGWEKADPTPAGRLRQFIDMLVRNRTDIKRSGCPVGSLCTELAKLGHASQKDAGEIFGLFRNWLKVQFEALGRDRDADGLALHLLARSQGVAMLANALKDDQFVHEEVRQMHAWLDALAGAKGSNQKPKRK